MNAQLKGMILQRDANKRAQLAAIVQADINAQARTILRFAVILKRLVELGIVEIPLDDDEPIVLKIEGEPTPKPIGAPDA